MSGDVFFVDSNVLLYYVDPVEELKRTRAIEWLDQLWTDATGRISWQVLHEFYWNAVRKMKMEPEDARGIVQDFSFWRPVDTSMGLVREAWRWVDEAQLTYWDALIVAAAQRSGARYLLTEDLQHGRNFGDLRVLDPFRHSVPEFF